MLRTEGAHIPGLGLYDICKIAKTGEELNRQSEVVPTQTTASLIGIVSSALSLEATMASAAAAAAQLCIEPVSYTHLTLPTIYSV